MFSMQEQKDDARGFWFGSKAPLFVKFGLSWSSSCNCTNSSCNFCNNVICDAFTKYVPIGTLAANVLPSDSCVAYS